MAVAGNGGDDSCGDCDFSDDLVSGVGDVQIAGAVESDAAWKVEFRGGCQAFVNAQISPIGLAVDSAGDLYIGGEFSQVRLLYPTNGFLYAAAGIGIPGYSGNGGSATIAQLYGNSQVAVGELGSLYIADTYNSRIRKVTLNLAATPAFSIEAGAYAAAQSVKLSDATTNSTIYYTTDGTTPTTASTRYTGAIAISATETIKAIAIAPGYAPSTVASATYTIQ